MLEEDKISRDDILEVLYCMGYYGHDTEEDRETELMSDEGLYQFYLEKVSEMDEEKEYGF